ncbi:ENTH-domain-containing protein [Mycena pura]|uniref:ENTH-domain-containing protein n=1 Tax=Mycena pura TaxID=153505 RepID=A0AAD6UVK2_9AGAR|nr:ENTH-domain-containing protein [Mycena pura]
MDRLEALGTSLSQITMYDIKSMYTQAKNVVLNVSEIEAKVREATNDDPWGASSTLMQDIANRTFNYPDFNEIMPSIYARFMEKEARQWRQIYKALQLLEYLVKNGSERVVDDARSHISTVKMLRNFHYIDEKGKDEGLNVRNRSRELVELLSDVEKIRAERRKAKANKSKYIGTGNDGMSFSSDGGRYGGFGNDNQSYGGGGSSDFYASGSGSGSGGGHSSSGFRDRDDRRGFDEYNAGDDEIGAVNSGRSMSPPSSGSRRSVPARKTSAPVPPPPVAPPVNLFDTDDDFSAPVAALAAPPVNKALPTVAAPVNVIDDDDFADFQVAPVQGATAAPPLSGTAPKQSSMNIFSAAPAATPAFGKQPARLGGTGVGMGGGMGGMGMGGGVGGMGTGMGGGVGGMGAGMGNGMGTGMGTNAQQAGHRYGGSISSPPMRPDSTGMGFGAAPMAPTPVGQPRAATSTGAAVSPAPAASKPASSFDDLWSMSLGSKPAATGATGAAVGGKSMKDLEKEKSMAGLWGSTGPKSPTTGSGMGMGGMGGGAAAPSASSGIDDLLG